MPLKSNTIKLVIGAILAATLTLTGGALGESMNLGKDNNAEAAELSEMKYDKKVMWALREYQGVNKHSNEYDEKINNFPQAKVMDIHLEQTNHKITGSDIRKSVKLVFDIDINYVSRMGYGNKLSAYDDYVMKLVRQSFQLADDDTSRDEQIMDMKKNQVMDRAIRELDTTLSGKESRDMINYIFGINLDGISGAEGAQLGIYSKGQWIIQADDDLFVISSSVDDVELYVYITEYYKNLTGSNSLPDSLSEKLKVKGFNYDGEKDQYIWVNETGESAPDAFKGIIIGFLLDEIAKLNTEMPVIK